MGPGGRGCVRVIEYGHGGVDLNAFKWVWLGGGDLGKLAGRALPLSIERVQMDCGFGGPGSGEPYSLGSFERVQMTLRIGTLGVPRTRRRIAARLVKGAGPSIAHRPSRARPLNTISLHRSLQESAYATPEIKKAPFQGPFFSQD